MVKSLPTNVGDAAYAGSVPGLGRSSEERSGNPLPYFPWIIPWKEKPGRLQLRHRVAKSQTRLRVHFSTRFLIHSSTKSQKCLNIIRFFDISISVEILYPSRIWMHTHCIANTLTDILRVRSTKKGRS